MDHTGSQEGEENKKDIWQEAGLSVLETSTQYLCVEELKILQSQARVAKSG